MKNVKRIIAACLASTMIMSMAACGNKENTPSTEQKEAMSNAQESSATSSTSITEEKLYYSTTGYYPICEEPITVTLIGRHAGGGTEWSQTEFAEQVEKQMGIKLDATAIDKTEWPTKLTLMLSSDELPDIVGRVNIDIAELNKYGAEGYFLPINEYLDIMPNLSAYFEKYPEYKAIVTAPDGNIYGLTQNDEREISLTVRTFINKNWLDNLGLNVPTNTDELYDVLKAFKEKDANGNGDPNDEIPLSSAYSNMINFYHAFGIFSNTMGYSKIIDESGKLNIGEATENYKEMLKYLRKLYVEGLYDNDALVQTTDEYKTKCADERIGMMTTGSAPYVEAGKEASYDNGWAYMAGLTSPSNDTAACVYSPAAGTTVRVAVNANTEYPEAICRLIDWMFTDEGAIAIQNGFIDVSCYWKEVPGVPGKMMISMREMEDIEKDYPGAYISQEKYRNQKAVMNDTFKMRAINKGTEAGVKAEMTEAELDQYCKAQGYVDFLTSAELGSRRLEKVYAVPNYVYTEEESVRQGALVTDVKMYTQQAFGQFVTGELDVEKDWDTYINTLEQIGLKELLEIEQAAYDRTFK